jgi:hypothetical protein
MRMWRCSRQVYKKLPDVKILNKAVKDGLSTPLGHGSRRTPKPLSLASPGRQQPTRHAIHTLNAPPLASPLSLLSKTTPRPHPKLHPIPNTTRRAKTRCLGAPLAPPRPLIGPSETPPATHRRVEASPRPRHRHRRTPYLGISIYLRGARRRYCPVWCGMRDQAPPNVAPAERLFARVSRVRIGGDKSPLYLPDLMLMRCHMPTQTCV